MRQFWFIQASLVLYPLLYTLSSFHEWMGSQEERNRQNDIISLISYRIIKTITKTISYWIYRGFVDKVAQRAGTETRYSFCYRFLHILWDIQINISTGYIFGYDFFEIKQLHRYRQNYNQMISYRISKSNFFLLGSYKCLDFLCFDERGEMVNYFKL